MSTEILRTEGVSKNFGAHKAVADVSLSVREGHLHCIIGPNGAGKTTLFNVLTKDLPPTTGAIFFQGRDVTGLAPYEISRLGIGRSYQITSIFANQTVYDNVWVAVYQHEGTGSFNFWRRYTGYPPLNERTTSLLELVGLSSHAGKMAMELSYGDQRLLEIAVTLATSPKLLLLDEPVNGLAQNETGKLARLIRDLVPRYTVLMIEHKMDVVMNISDRVSVMNFGEIIAEGTPQEMRDNADVKRAYFGA